MSADHRTTILVQQYLNALNGASPAEPIVRELLSQSVGRLQMLCGSMLFRDYQRLTRPPTDLQAEELLGALVERLIKAMREARPPTVRQFFGLANQHIRWELNSLARSLDDRPRAFEVRESRVPAPQRSASGLSPNARRIFEAIDRLPPDEREAFELVRLQGMTHSEAAEIIGTTDRTVHRRLSRALVLLTSSLQDLAPRGHDRGGDMDQRENRASDDTPL
ncbi:MAG: sigma-70 family RNA polymerase sigma factor [Planctomycetota bacterium]|nr:sigma-70 family RNA polymerase sigma factor [Planctomycetota bacterium]